MQSKPHPAAAGAPDGLEALVSKLNKQYAPSAQAVGKAGATNRSNTVDRAQGPPPRRKPSKFEKLRVRPTSAAPGMGAPGRLSTSEEMLRPHSAQDGQTVYSAAQDNRPSTTGERPFKTPVSSRPMGFDTIDGCGQPTEDMAWSASTAVPVSPIGARGGSHDHATSPTEASGSPRTREEESAPEQQRAMRPEEEAKVRARDASEVPTPTPPGEQEPKATQPQLPREEETRTIDEDAEAEQEHATKAATSQSKLKRQRGVRPDVVANGSYDRLLDEVFILSDKLHKSLGIDVRYKETGPKDLLSYPPVEKRPRSAKIQNKATKKLSRPLHRRKKKRHNGLKTALELEVERARRLPGPGDYSYPESRKRLNLFGKFPPHGYNGRTTLGEIELREKASFPGPWDYMIPSTLKTSGGANLKTARLRSPFERQLDEAAHTPGPGKYNPEKAPRYIPGFVFRPGEKCKTMFGQIEEAPGPGEYTFDPNASIHKPSPVKMCASSRPRPTFTDDCERLARAIPGPGAYDLQASDASQVRRVPQPVISGAGKPMSDLDWALRRAEESPAPGDYTNFPPTLSRIGGKFPNSDLLYEDSQSEDSYEW